MDPPSGPQTYRVVVEEADGSSHAHQLVLDRALVVGDVLEAGQRGWDGPRATIEEIDRHPSTHHSGAALAWPLLTHRLMRPRTGAPRAG